MSRGQTHHVDTEVGHIGLEDVTYLVNVQPAFLLPLLQGAEEGLQVMGKSLGKQHKAAHRRVAYRVHKQDIFHVREDDCPCFFIQEGENIGVEMLSGASACSDGA